MRWYTTEKQTGGKSRLPTEHAYTDTTKRLQVCGSCDKELRSSRSVTAANEIQPRRRSQGLDAGISAAARVHGRYHVITMYNPQTPFTRLHVPIREDCCEIARVCFACVSEQLLRLSFCPSPHTSSFSLSPLKEEEEEEEHRT